MPTANASSNSSKRRSSGFVPAARVRQQGNTEGEREYSLAGNEADPYDGSERITDRPAGEADEEGEHLTKNGKPDRRFKGQRDLPDEEVINPNYQPARTGGELSDGTHVTLDGKPDRRFKENRGMDDEEVNRKWAESVAEEYGITARH